MSFPDQYLRLPFHRILAVDGDVSILQQPEFSHYGVLLRPRCSRDIPDLPGGVPVAHHVYHTYCDYGDMLRQNRPCSVGKH